ncbi:hypothetical protein PYCC9005_004780 [Savitreella phatthalungensis]
MTASLVFMAELLTVDKAVHQLLEPIYGSGATLHRPYATSVLAVIASVCSRGFGRMMIPRVLRGVVIAGSVPFGIALLQGWLAIDDEVVQALTSSFALHEVYTNTLAHTVAVLAVLLPFYAARCSRPVQRPNIVLLPLLSHLLTYVRLPISALLTVRGLATIDGALHIARSARSRRTQLLPLACILIVGTAIWSFFLQTTLTCDGKSGRCADQVGLFDVLWSTGSGGLGRVCVVERRDRYRLLMSDGSLLGGMWLTPVEARGTSVFMTFYIQLASFLLLPTLPPNPNVLHIGLGIGTAPSAIVTPEPAGLGLEQANVTVIELNHAVTHAATTYFDLPSKINVITADARHAAPHPNTTTTRYDVINHDVFAGGSIPYDLLTAEYLGRLGGLLRENGVLALNVVSGWVSEGDRMRLGAVASTLVSLFGEGGCKVFVQGGEPDPVDNFIFFCTPNPQHPWTPKPYTHQPNTNLQHALANIHSWEYPISNILPTKHTHAAPVLRDADADGGKSYRWWCHPVDGGQDSRWRTVVLPSPSADTEAAATFRRFLRGVLPAEEASIWRTL